MSYSKKTKNKKQKKGKKQKQKRNKTKKQKTQKKGKKKSSYYQQHGLEVFLESNSWLHLFTNSTTDCSLPEFVQFYDNDSDKLLGVSAEGFNVYVHENQNAIDAEWLLELTQRLAH